MTLTPQNSVPRQQRTPIAEQGNRALTLHEHDNPACQGSTPISGHGEQVSEHSEEVLAHVGFAFELHPNKGVVGVTCCLQPGWAESDKRLERLVYPALLDEPPRRLGAEVDLRTDDDGKDDSGTKHEPPAEIFAETAKGNTHDFAQHDSKGAGGGLAAILDAQRIATYVHICHIITRAPRIGAGEHSAAYTGTVVDLDPIPSPHDETCQEEIDPRIGSTFPLYE